LNSHIFEIAFGGKPGLPMRGDKRPPPTTGCFAFLVIQSASFFGENKKGKCSSRVCARLARLSAKEVGGRERSRGKFGKLGRGGGDSWGKPDRRKNRDWWPVFHTASCEHQRRQKPKDMCDQVWNSVLAGVGGDNAKQLLDGYFLLWQKKVRRGK